MKTMVITEELRLKYKLPAKSAGEWFTEEVGNGYVKLHRIKGDGTPGSNRGNNIFKVPPETFMELANLAESKSYGEEEISEVSGKNWQSLDIGTRKSRWIAQLLGKMKSEPFTGRLLEKLGEYGFVKKVLEDTDSERDGGKAYSSIASALRVWKNRIRRGEYAG